ncbi:extracellular solute-binding protein [Haloferacaceae archaeon DSL9]
MQAAGASGIAVGLAGCLGAGDYGDRTVVINADSDFRNIQDAVQEALWEAGLDEGIEIAVEAGSGNTDSRRQEYTSALNAGRSFPDLFMMDSGWTIPFILRDQLLNLSENLPSGVLDRIENNYLDSTLPTASHPETGDLYGVPLFPDYPVMQYRKDLVEDAGYDPEGENWATEPMSWQRFSEIVADTQQQNADIDYGFTTQAAAYEGLACCTFNETMTSWGGALFGGVDNLFGPVGERPVTADSEPVIDTIRMMRTFMRGSEDEYALEGYEQICPTSIVQWQEEEARGPFTNGNAIAHRNWPYAVVINGADDAFGEDLGTMPIPYGVTEEEAEYEGTGGTSAALGGWHLTVNPNSEKRDLVMQVLEAFTADNVMLTIFERNGNIPPNIGLLDDLTEDDVGTIGRYLDTLEVSGENTIPRPVTDIWPFQSAVVFQEVHDGYTGRKTPQEAAGRLQTRLEESDYV